MSFRALCWKCTHSRPSFVRRSRSLLCPAPRGSSLAVPWCIFERVGQSFCFKVHRSRRSHQHHPRAAGPPAQRAASRFCCVPSRLQLLCDVLPRAKPPRLLSAIFCSAVFPGGHFKAAISSFLNELLLTMGSRMA